MQQILVLGAGKIGALITGLLADSGDYHVQLADKEAGTAKEVVTAHPGRTNNVPATKPPSVRCSNQPM